MTVWDRRTVAGARDELGDQRHGHWDASGRGVGGKVVGLTRGLWGRELHETLCLTHALRRRHGSDLGWNHSLALTSCGLWEDSLHSSGPCRLQNEVSDLCVPISQV